MPQTAWNNYAQSYNLLSKKLIESNIDISLLDKVITAYDGVIKAHNNTNHFTNINNKIVSKNLDQKIKVAKNETNIRKIHAENIGV